MAEDDGYVSTSASRRVPCPHCGQPLFFTVQASVSVLDGRTDEEGDESA